MNRIQQPNEATGREIHLNPGEVILHSIIQWWDDLVNHAIVSTFLVICWLTIVLGPPATFGIYQISYELTRGESQGLRGMLAGTRRFFGKSWLWMLANLLVFIIVYANFLFYGSLTWTYAWIIQIVMLLLGLLWIGVQFYTLPFLMFQEKPSFWTAWRNALLTFLASPGYTLVIWLFAFLVLVLSLITILPILLGTPALISVLGCESIRERIDTFRSIQRKQSEEPQQ